MNSRSGQRHICITRQGQEELLQRELTGLGSISHVEIVQPRVVAFTGNEPSSPPSPIFFSRQLLPHAAPVHAVSIKKWAQAIFEAIHTTFEGTPRPWCLHIFEPESIEEGRQFARQKLIEEELHAILKEKRRSYLRALSPTVTREITPETTLVQVCLVEPERGYISLASPELRSALPGAISPFLGGYVAIPDDKRPPSRAFKKLMEALTLWPIKLAAGSSCVDLGASPGGWSYVLLNQGCRVTAVDRAPLDPSISKHRNLLTVTGDAFSWEPPAPVSLMVCDVIAAPERSVELIKRWVDTGLCTSFCVTVKFKGDPDLGSLQELKWYLPEKTRWFDGKQLTFNKNEVTVVGELPTNHAGIRT